jgi:hypothetical protein
VGRQDGTEQTNREGENHKRNNEQGENHLRYPKLKRLLYNRNNEQGAPPAPAIDDDREDGKGRDRIRKTLEGKPNRNRKQNEPNKKRAILETQNGLNL